MEIRRPATIFAVLLASAGQLPAQAVVEYTLGTAASGAAAGSMQKAGQGIKGVFGALNATLEKANAVEPGKTAAATPASPSPPSSVVTVAGPATPQKKIEFKPVDPGKITEGMETGDLVKEFGEPSLKLSGATGTFWFYPRTGGGEWKLTIAGGKVTRVLEPEKPKPTATQAILLK